MVRVCYTISLTFLVVSCSFFGDKKKDLETAKDQVRQNMDFSEVTTYPLFEDCKDQELSDTASQRSCFFEQLSNHIYSYLKQEELVTNESVQDTLIFKIEVSRDGEFNLINLVHNGPETKSDTIKSLKLICNEAVASLPRIDAAQEKGELTTVRFDLPLVLSSH